LSTGGTDGTVQDLALIQLQPTGLRPLPWGDSSRVHSLEEVVAVGYGDAFDLLGPPSITQGSVSATGRDLGKCGGAGWIQHDAPLNHGNSGGPLLNQQGQVVGINTLKFDDQSACPSLSGFGFAIPSTPASATLGTLARLLPGDQGGLIAAIGERGEIAARSIPSKAAALPHLHLQVPVTWHGGNGTGQFSSRDGHVTMILIARSYRAAPTQGQLEADALRALRRSGPFTGMGVGPLSINAFSGIVVTVLPAHHSYRGDGMALLDSGKQVEVTVVRLVDPGATSRDRQEADALLLSLLAVL
ncbi:MAG: S1C family serine protease, partial [Chloroflexota bacterium]